jgi:hypothetical protein
MTFEPPLKSELYGADFRYFNNGFTIETEIIRGNYIQAGETTQKIAGLLHVAQMFTLNKKDLKYIEPLVRWDIMGETNANFSDANRLTFGLNFGFAPFNQTQFSRKAELRLNYAKYFVNKDKAPIYFGDSQALWHDKVILEFLFDI